MGENIWSDLDNKIKTEQPVPVQKPVQVSQPQKVSLPVTQAVEDNSIYAESNGKNKILFGVLNYFLDIIKITLGILLAFLIIYFIVKSQVDFSGLANDLIQRTVSAYNAG